MLSFPRMALEERIFQCRFLLVEGGRRQNAECTAMERPDCFELLVDQLDNVTKTPWPEKSLRLPKSLFIVVSNEREPLRLHLLMPLDMDTIRLPQGSIVPASVVAIHGRADHFLSASGQEQGVRVFSRQR